MNIINAANIMKKSPKQLGLKGAIRDKNYFVAITSQKQLKEHNKKYGIQNEKGIKRTGNI